MKHLDLNICGGKSVDLREVEAVPTPNSTDRWFPIPHGFFVGKVREALAAVNLKVIQERLTLDRFGQRLFGLMQVDNGAGDDQTGLIVSLRNSHDKSAAAGVGAGAAPFVCTNMIFSNEVVLKRRHTKNIFGDISRLITDAVSKLGDSWKEHFDRVELYKSTPLGNEKAAHLIMQAYQAKAINNRQIGKVWTQWDSPEHDCFKDRSLHSLYQGFTAEWRGQNPNMLHAQSERLNTLFDGVAGVQLAKSINQAK